MAQQNGTPMVNGQRQPVKLVKVSTDAVPAGPPPAQATAPAVSTTQAERRRVRRVRFAGLRAVIRHERTRAVYRVTVRHGAYLAGGARVLARRTWDGRTPARYERMIRSAEAGGHYDEIKEWEKRGYAFRAARHRRRMDMISGMLDAPRALASAACAVGGFLLALGCVIAWARQDAGYVLAPLTGVIELVGWLGIIVSIVWEPLTMALPFAALAGVWAVGRNRQTAPQWALPADATGRDVVPDEGAIINALRHLNVGPLNKVFKEGWQPRWVSGTGRLGLGWHTQLLLPLGVTVEMINSKKNVLAHNLLRKPIEVWPTEPRRQPGVLDLWIADEGSLSGPVPPWPLLTEGATDYFKGVPAGVSQRGDNIIARLMAANYMVGGIMGCGKTSLVIALLLGAMLDPIVDIDVYVMAYNVDYDPMKRRLRTLVKGDEDEQLRAALHALRDLRDEVTLRGKLLEELGGEEAKLTREIAERDPRMRPRMVVFDECHELFMHKTYGEEAAELAIKVMKKARKLGITLIWATVSPTAASIPKDVTRNTSHGAAFAVGDHVANDGLLGTGKHRAGITATTLSPGEDIGTCLTVGFTKQAFELMRTYWVRKDAEIDQITPVVDRAMALLDGTVPAELTAVTERIDPLEDIVTVMGAATRMLTQEVLQRLREFNRQAYGEWSFRDLRHVLDDAGHGEFKTDGGRQHVSLSRITEALAEREAP